MNSASHPALQYLAPEELKNGFPGFQKSIERRRKKEQADQAADQRI